MTVWPVPNWLFWESDIAKFIEAACYLLIEKDDKDLRLEVDYLVNLIESAQQKDGYLNIHFVVNEPEKRWSSLRDLHELYNAGHLIEAAVAHFQLTKSRQFIDVMVRFVRYTATIFGPNPDQKHGYPGHPEIELALLRLYNTIGDKECLQLAQYFIRQRGVKGGEYFQQEQEERGEHFQLAPAMMPKAGSYWYMQAHKPIIEQESIEGHSVRAMYLLTAVADLCILEKEGNKDLQEAVKRLWQDCCSTKTAITGGIGTVHQWEGFSIPYSIPHAVDEGGSYNETCASIGQLMLADRLQFLNEDNDDGFDGNRVGDIAERALYNASLTTGMSINGKAFTYDNALASSPDHLCERHTWFECACCPPNVLRTLASLTGYFWSPLRSRQGIAIHHYFDGIISDDNGNQIVNMHTNYPWDGKIQLEVNQNNVLIRIPAWAQKDATLSSPDNVEMFPIFDHIQKGYLQLSSKGIYKFDLALKPRLIYSHPYTNRDTLTIAYGPLIYCLEDIDNPFEKNHFKDLTINDKIKLTARISKDHDGIVIIEAKAAGQYLSVNQNFDKSVMLPEFDNAVQLKPELYDLTFIPYYYRANRQGGKGQMRCSIRRRYT
ncbi:hypothetical protein L7F22_052840 [Adiantum nelumboides]|nr:hypothetical protein [Adiantum nelumboides]